MKATFNDISLLTNSLATLIKATDQKKCSSSTKDVQHKLEELISALVDNAMPPIVVPTDTVPKDYINKVTNLISKQIKEEDDHDSTLQEDHDRVNAAFQKVVDPFCPIIGILDKNRKNVQG